MSTTFADIKEKVLEAYDLEEEVFIDDGEILTWANEGVADIEAEIHAIHDKYFETEEYLPLVLGQDTYDLPSDIYAFKITGMFYDNGSETYEIKPLKDKRLIPCIDDGESYRYRIVNSSVNGVKIKFYPNIREDSTENVTIHYIRTAKKFVDDASLLDIPIAENFIKQYILDKCANKERMTPDAPQSEPLKRNRELIVASLSQMIEDDNNETNIPLDFYEDHI